MIWLALIAALPSVDDPARYLRERDTVFSIERLHATERAFAHVNRRVTLRALFVNATRGAKTNTDRHIAVLRFLHAALAHDWERQPIDETGAIVQDPLILLELGVAWCGQAARVAVDLFDAAGYRGRLVQLGGHQISEIFYDGDWHYLDADIFTNGETVIHHGEIPSLRELSALQEKLDALNAYGEQPGWIWQNQPSSTYFAREAYRSDVPQFYVKKQNARDRYYGWQSYEVVPDPSRPLTDGPARIRYR